MNLQVHDNSLSELLVNVRKRKRFKKSVESKQHI